jgi:hypothetical protein
MVNRNFVKNLQHLDMLSIIFWNTTPYSPLKVNRCFGGTYRLNLQRTTRCYISEHSTVHNHRRKNPKSYFAHAVHVKLWTVLEPAIQNIV